MKRLLAVVAVAFLFGAIALNQSASAAAAKTSICHVDVDEGVFDHVIEVSDSSLPAHEAHGDEIPNNLPVGSECVVDGDPDT